MSRMRHQICLALIVKHARASKNFQRKSHMLFENIYLVETVDCKGGKHINWAQFVCGWGAQTWQRVGRVRSLLAETRTHKGLRSYRGWVIPLLIVIQMRSPVWTIHICLNLCVIHNKVSNGVWKCTKNGQQMAFTKRPSVSNNPEIRTY